MFYLDNDSLTRGAAQCPARYLKGAMRIYGEYGTRTANEN